MTRWATRPLLHPIIRVPGPVPGSPDHMRKTLCLLIFLTCFTGRVRANHITGGEMHYTYIGQTAAGYQYNVELKLFMRCNSGRVFPNPIIVSIFDKGSYDRITDMQVPLGNTNTIQLVNSDPCISNPPNVCYETATYQFDITLPASADGYILSASVNFRINGISNIESNASQVGATYTAEIPGTGAVANGMENNSAVFTASDLVVVCANNTMSYSFSAEDPDGDQLQYSFCSAYGSGVNVNAQQVTPINPPYPSVPYLLPDFNSDAPLGPLVSINNATGQITGVAPAAGIYVVTVCVNEIRNGQIIATQRKDIQINIADCNIAAATLSPVYMLCRDTRSITIANQSTSPLIVSWDWTVFDPAGNIIHTISNPLLNFTFPDTGTYRVKLVVNKGQQCSDSSTASVKVYPGFRPDFSVSGVCAAVNTQFTDRSTTVYGVVSSWLWDFGDLSTFSDVSIQQNPTYSYPSLGTRTVRLIASTSKGCRDTVLKEVDIFNEPPLKLKFSDTLICRNDIIRLTSNAIGTFVWTPAAGMINPNTSSPTVTPQTTTTYYVTLDQNGCIGHDSVKVRVVDRVSLQMMSDSMICLTDPAQLHIQSDGLKFLWTPAASLNDATLQNPLATPTQTTTYIVTATVGGCSTTGQVTIGTAPYPKVNAGRDTAICYNTPALLQGSNDGTIQVWTHAGSLTDANILHPLAYPPRTTTYILKGFDTKGCPKPGTDTVVVTVQPKMSVFAGRDTSLVVGQPIHLQGSGGQSYTWTPGIFLNNANIADPVALFSEPVNGFRYKLTARTDAGCSDSAFITIRVFKAGPSIYMPTAFTPNHDGKNDVLRPIAAGIQSIEYFRIFNRWGQMIYSSSTTGAGWDGRFSGTDQATGTYVWLIKAVDYKGLPYFSKGVVTLIR